MSDGRRSPCSCLSLYQWSQGWVRAGRLPPGREKQNKTRYTGTSSTPRLPHFSSMITALVYLVALSLVSRDDHVAFGLVIVAHALHAVDLGQLVDDLPMLSVHRRETVAPLRLLSLQKRMLHKATVMLAFRMFSCISATKPHSWWCRAPFKRSQLKSAVTRWQGRITNTDFFYFTRLSLIVVLVSYLFFRP